MFNKISSKEKKPPLRALMMGERVMLLENRRTLCTSEDPSVQMTGTIVVSTESAGESDRQKNGADPE